MPRIKAKDLRGLSAAELRVKRHTLEKELFELQQKKVTGQLEKPHLFKSVRRQIAQVNTVARDKKNG